MRDFAAGHPPTEEAAEIVRDLGRALGRDGLECHPGVSYRHLLVWRGGEGGMRTKPPHDLSDKPVAGHFPEGPGADVLRDLMERSRPFLATHPLCQARAARGERVPTAIWLWGQGKRPQVPTLRERFGVEGSVIAAVDLVNGLGVLAGLEKIAVPGATGFLDTNFRGKAEYGLRALAERDFLFLHVEAPDEGGHMGDAQKKVEAIENVDEKVVGPLLEGLRASGSEWRMLVMPDHPTPCALKTHTDEPVPFVVYIAIDGTVVIGEGAEDAMPKLYVGEKVGTRQGPATDVALDALEGAAICAAGGYNALSVIAIAEHGTFLRVPDTYMDKIACGPEGRGAIDLDQRPRDNLKALADARGVYVEDLTVAILDRPRHNALIEEVRRAGARIKLITSGDVSAALATTRPDTGIDILMGVGGAPQGVLAAAFLLCVGGEMQARLKPRNEHEAGELRKLGLFDLQRKYGLEELASGSVMCAATGITPGDYLHGVRYVKGGAVTNSVVMRSATRTVRFIEAHHRFDRRPEY